MRISKKDKENAREAFMRCWIGRQDVMLNHNHSISFRIHNDKNGIVECVLSSLSVARGVEFIKMFYAFSFEAVLEQL
jgi:hypothetical protein